jgi:hypothetical protein
MRDLMGYRRFGAGLAVALALASTAAAPSPDGAWQILTLDRAAVLTGTAIGGTAQVRLVCDLGEDPQDAPLQLTFEGLAGWTPGGGARLVIDGQPFAMQVDVDGPDFARMNHRPGRPGWAGIDLSLFAALESGTSLQIDGPGAAAMAPELRQFALADGRSASARFRAHCGF